MSRISNYNVYVLTRCVLNKDISVKKSMNVVPLNEPGEPAVVSFPLSKVDSLSSVRLFIPKDLLPLQARENTLWKILEVLSRFSKGWTATFKPRRRYERPLV